MTTAVSNTATPTPTRSTVDAKKFGEDYNQFLTLLTTQLKNQDPLAPMDSTQFTSQLVQFSSVEQQIKANSNLEKLLSTQTLNLTALGVSFIGKDVEVAGTSFQTGGGKNVSLSYMMPATATTGTISIMDATGNTVYSRAPDLTTGKHDFIWDGKDSNGQAVPAGKYTIKIGALTAENAALNVSTFVPGHVNSLETGDDGSMVLDVDGQKVPLTDVTKISLPSI